MAKIVGFENVIKPVPPKKMYNSKSKGAIEIEGMATPHIENALRGQMISAFASLVKGKKFQELIAFVNTMTMVDFLQESQVIEDFYDELEKRSYL
jgi:hypothetical protein